MSDPEATASDQNSLDRRTMKARWGGHQYAPSQTDEAASDVTGDEVAADREYRELRHVKAGVLAFPRSAYEGYRPLLPGVPEQEALTELRSLLEQQNSQPVERPAYKFVILEEFVAYRHPCEARRSNELAGLETVQVHRGVMNGLLFDGILRVGEVRRYVQGVPFNTITVEGYGDPGVTDLSDRICVQSSLAARSGVWYQLGHPSMDYKRFYEPFLWLAEFTKHFVDYLMGMEMVVLDDFRFCFHDWLITRYEDDTHLRQWLHQCKLRDFRTTISAHIEYLWKECNGVEADGTGLLDHPVWGEVDPYNLKAIQEQPNKEKMTVVTPFAYDMFKHMYFSKHLDARQVTDKTVASSIRQTKTALGLTPFKPKHPRNSALFTPKTQRSTSPMMALSINKGDVVCLDADKGGKWKSASSTWYAYVQAVRVNGETGRTLLDVLWLYEPQDTTFGAAYYPYENELFLSDNCGCGHDAIGASLVKSKVQVSWYAKDPKLESGLFVRQKFRTAHDEGTDDFVTLKPADFACRCGDRLTAFEECRLEYGIGETVLVKIPQSQAQDARLDPAVLVDFNLSTEQVILQQLRRRSEVDKSAPLNELTPTDVIYAKPAKHIIRRCHVRRFDGDTVAAGLPTGYDRRGAGDFYFIVNDSIPEQESAGVPPMTAGLDLVALPPFEKLTGMGIFCGGGSFDRGLEDGGAVDFKYAVDWAERALHTYRANSHKPDKMQCFLGSVDDYLALAMKGGKASSIASPGEIGLIAAGSPCPGFSNLQRDKASDASLRNASMVASVVSFVDVFCPQYCIHENVVTMTAGMGRDKTENVFAQIIAAFVAMGYQVRTILLDCWSHGSSQSRSRIFIVASAPGLEPFPLPQLTHDHPRSDMRLHALGKASNGRSFGLRRDEYTPLRCNTAARSTSDLPDIADGQSRICPSFPDHLTPSREDAAGRDRIASVPTQPRGMSLADAVSQRLVAGEPAEFIQRSSSVKRGLGNHSYSRVRPDSLFPAVTTQQRLACGFTGRTIHWDQNRSLTVMELRRAMGFQDHEVIIGSPAQKVQIIGNSVDRAASFALGLCVRESWAKSCAKGLSGGHPGSGFGLVSPPPSEDDAEQSSLSPRGSGNDRARSVTDRGGRQQADRPEAVDDMLRAGASAVAKFQWLDQDVGYLARGMRANVIELTAGESEDGDEASEDGGNDIGLEDLPQRPTAYVKISRILDAQSVGPTT